VFSDVTNNAGQGYDVTSGLFVVPRRGCYLFTVTIRAHFHKTISSEIVHNDDVMGRLTTGDGRIERSAASMTLIIECEVDDVIYVRHTGDKSADYNGNGCTSFSGFLID